MISNEVSLNALSPRNSHVSVKIFLSLIFILCVMGNASASTLYVDDAGNCNENPCYTTIQNAVDAANAGDTVIVKDGTYEENVVVNKKLSIMSEGGPKNCVVQVSDSNKDGFLLKADNVTIKGFTIIGSKSISSSSGIYLSGITNGSVINNNISKNKFGIYVDVSNYNTIRDNNVTVQTYIGIEVSDSDYNLIIDNIAANNQWDGINLSKTSNDNKIANNKVFQNSQKGIDLFKSNNNVVKDNMVGENRYGIQVKSSTDNNITGNKVKQNSDSGIILQSSESNLVYNNVFNNSDNYQLKSSTSDWNVTKTSGDGITGGNYVGGNAWFKPDGTGFSEECLDKDIDGLCDDPYQLDSSNVDYLPLFPVDSAPSPVITSYFPSSPVNDLEGEKRTFNVTVNQTTDVYWYVNSTQVQSNLSVTNASYTSIATTGVWNVSAIAKNIYGSDSQKWIWEVEDVTPPPSITNLQHTTGNFWIEWSWDNPDTDDFSHVMVYIDGNWKSNTSNSFYEYTTEAHQTHKISTLTVDESGNVNYTWVNQTATVPNNEPVMEAIGDKTVTEGQTVYVDANASDADGDNLVYSCNRTDLFDFDSSTGEGSWTTETGDLGTYYVDFGVSDGCGGVDNETVEINVVEPDSTPPPSVTDLENTTGID